MLSGQEIENFTNHKTWNYSPRLDLTRNFVNHFQDETFKILLHFSVWSDLVSQFDLINIIVYDVIRNADPVT